jgi:hypothetical protein
MLSLIQLLEIGLQPFFSMSVNDTFLDFFMIVTILFPWFQS